MAGKIKLSNIQAQVIDALSENEGSHLYVSPLYHWSKVIHNKEILILSIHKPTVEVLIRLKLIVPTDKDKIYKLNPEIKFN